MELTELQAMLIEILRRELIGSETEEPTSAMPCPEQIVELYRLSKHHDLAHIVSSFLTRSGWVVEEEIKKKFQRQEMISVFRYEQMKLAYDEICQALEEGQIDYLPLKGSVLRPYYPKESMRTSCDIDILVREPSLEHAVAVLTERGYTCKERHYHDVSLYSPFGTHLELHFHIRENQENLDRVLERAWDYAYPVQGHQYAFRDGFFVFHMLAHMAYHFLSGGCGLRSFMDLWVMQHPMGLDKKQAEALLDEAEILPFAEEMLRLSDICFSGVPKDEMADRLLAYVMNGGVYGSSENQAAMTPEAKTTVTYMTKRVLVPYGVIAMEYPSAKKCPILYPFCLVGRTGRLFFRFVKRSLRKRKIRAEVTHAHLDEATLLRQHLGL